MYRKFYPPSSILAFKSVAASCKQLGLMLSTGLAGIYFALSLFFEIALLFIALAVQELIIWIRLAPTHRDLPACVSPILGLKAFATRFL